MSKTRTAKDQKPKKKFRFASLFRPKKSKTTAKIDQATGNGVTPMQQVKSSTLTKIQNLAGGRTTKNKAFNSLMLYQLSDEIKWFVKQSFMDTMKLKDTQELEKECDEQTKMIKDDIIQAKKSDADPKWIQQQVDSAVYINVHVYKIKSIEQRYKTVGAWLYESDTSEKGDLSHMQVITNAEVYEILRKYFDNFIEYF